MAQEHETQSVPPPPLPISKHPAGAGSQVGAERH
jgi:hypothetical protein